MKIRFNVKPYVIEGSTKQEVLRKAGLGGWIIDNNGSRYMVGLGKDDKVKAINLEKHRKTVKVLKNGNRKIIRGTYWVGYIYDFTKFGDLVKVKQKTRNFEVIFK